MKEYFKQLIIDSYSEIPVEVYEGLVSFLCVLGVSIICLFGIKRGWRKISGCLLIEYIFLTFCSTIFVRNYSEEFGNTSTPFWSYMEIMESGRVDLIADNIMNVLVFIPTGLFAGMAITKIQWWHVLFGGCLVSVIIEISQFVLKIGFSETDDVIHNTLGCMIGYGFYKGVQCIVGRVQRKNIIKKYA